MSGATHTHTCRQQLGEMMLKIAPAILGINSPGCDPSTLSPPLWEVNRVSLSSLRVPRLREPCVPVNLARMLGGTPDFLRALSRARSLASSSSESESEARRGGLLPTHFVVNTPQHAYSRICTHMRAYARICICMHCPQCFSSNMATHAHAGLKFLAGAHVQCSVA